MNYDYLTMCRPNSWVGMIHGSLSILPSFCNLLLHLKILCLLFKHKASSQLMSIFSEYGKAHSACQLRNAICEQFIIIIIIIILIRMTMFMVLSS